MNPFDGQKKINRKVPWVGLIEVFFQSFIPSDKIVQVFESQTGISLSLATGFLERTLSATALCTSWMLQPTRPTWANIFNSMIMLQAMDQKWPYNVA
jgi:hypothetical protein